MSEYTEPRVGEEAVLEAGNEVGLSVEEKEQRWGFLCKVYTILAALLLVNLVISAMAVFYTPSYHVFRGNIGLLVFFCILPFILLCSTLCYIEVSPLNVIVVGLFDMSVSLLIGAICARTNGKVVVEVLILMSTVVCFLIGYSFLAAKKGWNFSLLGLILCASLVILVLASIIQVSFPIVTTTTAIYGGIAALIYCGIIVYETGNMFKIYKGDEHADKSVKFSFLLYISILVLLPYIRKLLTWVVHLIKRPFTWCAD